MVGRGGTAFRICVWPLEVPNLQRSLLDTSSCKEVEGTNTGTHWCYFQDCEAVCFACLSLSTVEVVSPGRKGEGEGEERERFQILTAQLIVGNPFLGEARFSH